LAERWWVGCGLMLFWAVMVMVIAHGCARGGEVTIAWDAPPAGEEVS